MDAGARWASGSSQRCFAGALDPLRASHASRVPAQRSSRRPRRKSASVGCQRERCLPGKAGRRCGQPGMPVRLPGPDDARIVGAPVPVTSVRERRETRVVPALALRMPEDAPPRERAPVHGARQPYQRIAGDHADDAGVVLAPFEPPDQIDFRPARGLFHVGGADPLVLQPLVDPRDEQHVPQPRLDVRRPRKQRVRHRVAQAPETHLVERALLVEQVQHAPHLVAVARRQVDPRQRRLHRVVTFLAIPDPRCSA